MAVIDADVKRANGLRIPDRIHNVDIDMLHRDNPALGVDVIMDCLAEFVAEGRVKYLACSNWTVERHRQANEYAAAHGMPGFVVNELMWSMAKPNADVLPSDYMLMDEDMLKFGKKENINSLSKKVTTRWPFSDIIGIGDEKC